MIALALAMSASIERRDAMERCAAAVMAKLHPRMGMADVTGTKFEGLQASSAGNDWVVIGSIIEPDGSARVAHRFTCRTRGKKAPRVTLDNLIRL
ncbi:MAG: hypothetical protein ABIQ43_05010 [Sphingomonas sp.]